MEKNKENNGSVHVDGSSVASNAQKSQTTK